MVAGDGASGAGGRGVVRNNLKLLAKMLALLKISLLLPKLLSITKKLTLMAMMLSMMKNLKLMAKSLYILKPLTKMLPMTRNPKLAKGLSLTKHLKVKLPFDEKSNAVNDDKFKAGKVFAYDKKSKAGDGVADDENSKVGEAVAQSAQVSQVPQLDLPEFNDVDLLSD